MEIKTIKYDDNGKWISTSYNINIGYIKKYDPIRKFGYIQQYSGIDVFFHISNSITKDIRVGKIIGFVKVRSIKYPNKFEATHINLAENYTSEFKEAKFKFSDTEWKMVMKGNKELFLDSIGYGYDSKVKLKENLKNHINTTNIDDIIELYQVEVICGGRCKLGDDDSAWVHIKSNWLRNGESSRFIPSDFTYDIYIKNLFPCIDKEIYYERAFCPYYKMLEIYKADKENWKMLEQEASQMESEIKLKVKKEYDQELHQKILEEYLTKEIRDLFEKAKSDVNDTINSIYWGEYNKVLNQ